MNLFSQSVKPTTGILLAGGASRRMGRDKATLPWGKETVLQHLIRELLPRLEPLIVVGQPGFCFPVLHESLVLVKDETPYQGPLIGFCNGLQHAPVDQPVFLCGCDFPFMKRGVVDFLHQNLDGAEAVLGETLGIAQPLAGVYQPEATSKVGRLVKEGGQSMHALLKMIQYRIVPEALWQQFDPAGMMLTNINTFEEYSVAHERYLASLD